MSASGMIAMTKAVGTAVPTCSAMACGLRLTDMLGPITASEIAMAPRPPRLRFNEGTRGG